MSRGCGTTISWSGGMKYRSARAQRRSGAKEFLKDDAKTLCSPSIEGKTGTLTERKPSSPNAKDLNRGPSNNEEEVEEDDDESEEERDILT